MPITRQNMHSQFLEEVREQIATLKSDLCELQAVERFHAARVNGSTSPTLSDQDDDDVNDISGNGPDEPSKHEATEAVLADAGHPLKVTDICDQLQAKGYSPHLSRKLLYNAVYTALKRKTDLFYEMDDDSGKWGLMKWKEDADS